MGYKSNKGALTKKIKAAQKAAVDRAGKRAADIAKGLCLRDSGRLAASIETKGRAEAEAGGFLVEVGSDLPYAQIQEKGPSDGRPYKYKPYLQPALMQISREMPNILNGETDI